VFRLDKYYFDEKDNMIKPLIFSLSNFKNKEIHEQFNMGIESQAEYEDIVKLYGKTIKKET
jgi:hypothetical protein